MQYTQLDSLQIGYDYSHLFVVHIESNENQLKVRRLRTANTVVSTVHPTHSTKKKNENLRNVAVVVDSFCLLIFQIKWFITCGK